jgi:6-phosphogluconolactonase
VADEAARRFVALARDAIAARGRFTVALAGGSTPKAMFERLARPPLAAEVDWQKLDVFFGDERSVPATHPDSNYGMAARALLDHVPVDPSRVHRIAGEDPDAAEAYEQILHTAFPDAAPFPAFDLILLGMGPDGHTASLFPHTAALGEQTRWLVRNHVQKLHTDRITFTAPLINAARQVIIATGGAEKAPVLRALAHDPEDPQEHPILLIRPASGRLTWLLDRAGTSTI